MLQRESRLFHQFSSTRIQPPLSGIFQDYYFTNPVYLQRIKKSSSASLTELSENCKSLITLVRSAVPASLEHTNSHTLSDVLAALDFYFDLFCEKLTGFIKWVRCRYTFGADMWHLKFQLKCTLHPKCTLQSLLSNVDVRARVVVTYRWQRS